MNTRALGLAGVLGLAGAVAGCTDHKENQAGERIQELHAKRVHACLEITDSLGLRPRDRVIFLTWGSTSIAKGSMGSDRFVSVSIPKTLYHNPDFAPVLNGELSGSECRVNPDGSTSVTAGNRDV